MTDKYDLLRYATDEFENAVIAEPDKMLNLTLRLISVSHSLSLAFPQSRLYRWYKLKLDRAVQDCVDAGQPRGFCYHIVALIDVGILV